VRVGTRGSALALAQARAVAEGLAEPAELMTITTAGDRNRAAGDKSRWTGALEEALLAGAIDLAVHSAKDVPGDVAPGTELLAAPRRADAADVLVGAPALEALAPGARVGTSALRRRAQLLAVRDDLDVAELRGNVPTRLRKLAEGEVDALVLARAGLDRLGLLTPGAAAVRGPEAGELPAAVLGDTVFVPAPGQGVIAVQGRAGDARAREAAGALLDPAAWAALRAERAAVRTLGASCHTPVGIHAAGGVLRGFAGLPDGSAWVLDEVPDAGDPEAAGEGLARRMLAAGAGELLAEAETRAVAGPAEP
jgi:hydroxymethylbilane synthase